MAQWVKALADKPDGLFDLSDALGEKEPAQANCSLTSTYK